VAVRDAKARAVFWDVHSGLPRQGPGSRESTARALALAAPIPSDATVLDIACGPGMQTLHLAELLPQATICAIDQHEPFVDETNRRAASSGKGDRVRAISADMRSLAFAPATFDLIWCEGAAYIMGVDKALRAWRPFLKNGGRLALSEAVWLRPDPPDKVRRIWADDYPHMRDVAACRSLVRDCGYRLLGDFVLPEAAWWEYYGPKEQRIKSLAAKYAADADASTILREGLEEIGNFRNYSAYYGYAFLVVATDEAALQGQAEQ
jgi:ubiquinone/menaquinone biosynthesis C-methylase UbiE